MERIQKTKFVYTIVFLSVGFYSMAGINSSETSWELAKSKDGISLYYRWITQGDSINTREMKAVFEINAGINEILSHFNDTGSYESWAAGIKKCKIEITSDSLWFTHTIMNYPFPFKQKDLVTRHQVIQEGINTTLRIEAAPEFLRETKGVERIKNYQGEWSLTHLKSGATKVDYRVVSFTKPLFPRFIQDPVIQQLCIRSFSDLKLLAENHGNKKD